MKRVNRPLKRRLARWVDILASSRDTAPAAGSEEQFPPSDSRPPPAPPLPSSSPFKVWQSRISYRCPPCDIPLFFFSRTDGIMGCNRCAEEERHNPGGDQCDCNFRHALFSEGVRSVRLPDYLHFEKRWQGNCRHVLQSPEVISQHSQRYHNVLKRRADAAWILLRLGRQNNRHSQGPIRDVARRLRFRMALTIT